VALSAFLYGQNLDRHTGAHPYAAVGQALAAIETGGGRVMVNDPATFYYATGRECLSIPNEPLDVVVGAMERYGGRYLILDGQYQHLSEFYADPESNERFVVRQVFGEGEGRLILVELVEDRRVGRAEQRKGVHGQAFG